MTLLLNNTILSNFSTIAQPRLVLSAFEHETIVTVSAVLSEYRRGVVEGHFSECDWTWLSILALTPDEEKELAQMPRHLGEGESACLVVARMRGMKFATDDWDARQTARRWNIPLTGTLGILIVLVKDGKLAQSDADKYLAQMIKSGFRAPGSSIKNFL